CSGASFSQVCREPPVSCTLPCDKRSTRSAKGKWREPTQSQPGFVFIFLKEPRVTKSLCRASVLLLSLFLIVCNVRAQSNKATAANQFDVIIKNGRIIDGSGNPWSRGDIGIRGERIAVIGRLANTTAGRVIDASGLVVAPGFIDTLGQSEMALLIDNRALSK